MNQFENYGGTQYNAPGGTQNFGIPPEQVGALIAQAVGPLADKVAAAGVKEQAVVALAGRIAEKVQDWDEAVRTLEEFITIAIRVQEEGRHGSNLGHFVDEVLRRTASFSADGKHETAIAELDEALAREEAESKARTHRLLSAAIDQHLLAFDATGAAEKIARRVDLDTADPADRFEALCCEQINWEERGERRGRKLDQDIAVQLATIMRERANGDDQLSLACERSGCALLPLGKYESAVVLLSSAIEACPPGPGDRRARVLHNLGCARISLGLKLSNIAILEEAVTALEEARALRLRDSSRVPWAKTQEKWAIAKAVRAMLQNDASGVRQAISAFVDVLELLPADEHTAALGNLGNALAILGRIESDQEGVDAAIAAYTTAQRAYNPLLSPTGWLKVTRNLALALTDSGKMNRNPALLQRALSEHDSIFWIVDRGRLPEWWTRAKLEIGDVHLALFDIIGDAAALDLAQASLDDAHPVFAEVGAAQYLAQADQLQAKIDHCRSRLKPGSPVR